MRRWLALSLILLAGGGASAELDVESIQGKTVAECESLREAYPQDLFAYLCYYLAARNHRQWDQAVPRFEALLQETPDEPRLQLYLGLMVADLGQPRAEQLFRSAADGFAAESEQRGEVWSRISLSVNLQFQGRFEEAEQQLDRARGVAEERGETALIGEVVLSQGWVKQQQSELGPAWTLFETARTMIVPDAPVYLQIRLFSGLAVSAWGLGMYPEAYEHYRHQLELIGDTNPIREASVRSSLALVANRLAHLGVMTEAEARSMKEQALASAIAAGAKRAEVTARLMLAESLEYDPDMNPQIELALEQARALSMRSEIIWALGLLAENHALGDPVRALPLVDEAEELARQMGDPERLARTMLIRSVVHMRREEREQAIQAGFSALDRIERIRDLQVDQQVRARVFGRFDRAYRRLAAYLFDSGDERQFAQGFRVTERLRARSLLDRLDAGRLTETLTPAVPAAQQRSAVLLGIAEVQRRLRDGSLDEPTRDELLSRLDALEIREFDLRETLAAAHPDFGAIRLPVIPELAQVQADLEPDQAMLSYVIASQSTLGSWVLVLTRNRVVAVRLQDSGSLHREITTYLGLLQRRDGTAQPGSSRLHRLLLDDALDALPPGVRRLVIVPDGALHRLPFGALLDANGTPLVLRHEITVAPSASTWWHWKGQPTPEADTPLLALADPSVASPADDELLRSVDPFVGGPIGALPHARREVRTMRRMLGRTSRVLTGADASEHELKTLDLSQFRIVHLAAHAIVDEQRPERSAVLLAPGADHEDGLLQFREVVDLDMDGRIVILTACRSASGPILGGDGAMGLAHAFFLAGSRTVVAGLWPLRDDEVSVLVEPFATALAQGQSVAGALAEAQAILAREGLPAASWAGLVVMGDGDQVPLPGGRNSSGATAIVVGAGILALALVAMTVAWIRRRSRTARI